MKALVHDGNPGIEGLSIQEVEKKTTLNPNEIRIQIKSVGLNHRDLFTLVNHKESEEPVIIGADGAGIITELGSGISHFSVGDEVIINPGMGWNKNAAVAPENFQLLGYPLNGSFVEEIILPEENIGQKPSHLTWEEAGVLSLSALTAYRALFTKGKVVKGTKLLIPGIGGGVATFLLQFAVAVGAEVYVTSRSKEKLAKAKELGAVKIILSDEDWNEAIGSIEIDTVIDSVGSATFNKSLGVLKRGGTIVTFGSSTNDIVELNLRQFFYGQYTLKGSTMGSRDEFLEMLDFVNKHQLKPVMETVFPFQDYSKAFDLLKHSKQMGKIGLFF